MKRIQKKIQKTLQDRRYERFLPDNHRLEDIFLVSFPKSGNTWLRFLIASAIRQQYNLSRGINFFSIHEIIPDIVLSRKIRDQGIFGEARLPRIIKSHAAYNPYYHRALVLVRDPRDAIVSYYHYLKNYNRAVSGDMSLSQFIRHKKYGAEAWAKHTDSWLHVNRSEQIIKFFRYEDLLKDTEKQLYLMLDLMGLETDSENLKTAITACSKENMQQSETRHMSAEWLNAKQTSFVRQAKASKGSSLSDTDRNFIENLTRETAQQLGYQY
ncbi:MAG: sulfotransferase domain-containing protein [Cyanobacteria bacterium P01_A01_bin.114]